MRSVARRGPAGRAGRACGHPDRGLAGAVHRLAVTGARAPMLDTLTMQASRRTRRWGRNALHVWMTPQRLTASTFSICCDLDVGETHERLDGRDVDEPVDLPVRGFVARWGSPGRHGRGPRPSGYDREGPGRTRSCGTGHPVTAARAWRARRRGGLDRAGRRGHLRRRARHPLRPPRPACAGSPRRGAPCPRWRPARARTRAAGPSARGGRAGRGCRRRRGARCCRRRR